MFYEDVKKQSCRNYNSFVKIPTFLFFKTEQSLMNWFHLWKKKVDSPFLFFVERFHWFLILKKEGFRISNEIASVHMESLTNFSFRSKFKVKFRIEKFDG